MRLSLSQRISYAFALAFAFAIGISGYVFIGFQQLGVLSRAEARIGAAAQAAYQLRVALLRGILLLERYEDTGDPKKLDELDASQNEAEVARQSLRKHTRLPEVRQILDRYEALLPERTATIGATVEALQSREDAARLTLLKRARDRWDDDARDMLKRIVVLEESALHQAKAELESYQDRLTRHTVGLTLLNAVLIAALLYSLIAGGITRRLSQLSDMARKIAAGDYSQREFERHEDEVGMLANTFNDMARQLAEFDKVKEDFVALASHQLRTPATAVKGNLGMLLEGYCGELTAEQREILKDANDSNERQLAVIEDMLWVARTDSGRLTLAKAPTDLGILAEAVVVEQMHVAKARAQTLTLEKPDHAVTVTVDAQKIRMVFENLLSNASKYTPEGGQVSVALREVNGSAILAVADTGVGIAAEDMGRLFSKFSRVANPLSEKVGGTGLGLFLANEIVKLHSGAIRVDSRLGAGTTFTVTLPRDGADHGQDPGG